VDVDVVLRWADARTNIDDGSFSQGSPPTDDPWRLNLSETFFSRAQTRWTSLDGCLDQRVAFYYTNYDRDDTNDTYPASYQGQTRKVDWQADLKVMHGNVLTVGIDYLDEGASSFTPEDQFVTFAKASQNRAGIYIQDQIQIGERWYNTVGFRWEDHSAAGPSQTYQFRSTYHVHETGTAFHGTLGSGFRAPSLAENLFPFGNPNLAPEDSRGWDIGMTQRLCCDQLIVEFYYYRNDFRNLIQYDFNSNMVENIGTARTHGVEVLGLWNLNPTTAVNASYTRTDSLNGDPGRNGAPLSRRPRDKGSLGVVRRFCDGCGTVNLYALFFGDSSDSVDGSVFVDGYTLLNLAANYQVTKHIGCFCRFDNLLNEHYEVVTGYGTPLFSAFGGVDFNW
jgi:vitamin B12 transporter